MWSWSNLFQLSRERWWWHRFCKLLGILLWAPINFFYGIQKRFSGLSYSTHMYRHVHTHVCAHTCTHVCTHIYTHTPLPLTLPTCVHLQTSTSTERPPRRWYDVNRYIVYPGLELFWAEAESGRSIFSAKWNVCFPFFVLKTWEVV